MHTSSTSAAATVASSATTLLRRAMPDRRGPGKVLTLMGRIEQARQLDGLAAGLRRAVRAVPLGEGRDVLHGRWLGHPLHPLMVQVPIGAWISSAALDWTPGGRRPATFLLAVGLAGAGPAVLAGVVDWAELEKEQARVGLVHAALNVVGVTCYSASLLARLTGHHVRGRTLALAGLSAVGAAGAVGGHLAYRQAAGANHAEAVPHLVPPGWQPIGRVDEFARGAVERRTVGDVAVAVVHDGNGTFHVLADRCSHEGGPLSEGRIEDECLVCPWHGSAFRLENGWNRTGPATAPQPVFDTRVDDGRLHVRLRTPPPAPH